MGKKQKTTDWTLQHHDGVSEKCMIARPARPPMKIEHGPGVAPPPPGTMYAVEIVVMVDGRVEDQIIVTEEAYTPVQAMVRALRGLADSLERAAAG